MEDIYEKMTQELRSLSDDIGILMQNEKQRIEREEKELEEGTTEAFKEKRLRSLQQITTFYSSKKDAEEKQKNPIMAFVDKRLKEIFG